MTPATATLVEQLRKVDLDELLEACVILKKELQDRATRKPEPKPKGKYHPKSV
jgi:hypothetical protein